MPEVLEQPDSSEDYFYVLLHWFLAGPVPWGSGEGWLQSIQLCRPFSRGTSFAPMLCSPQGSHGSSFKNTLKSPFLPTWLGILLIPSSLLLCQQEHFNVHVVNTWEWARCCFNAYTETRTKTSLLFRQWFSVFPLEDHTDFPLILWASAKCL